MSHVFRSLIRITGFSLVLIGILMLMSFVVSALSRELKEGFCFLWLGACMIGAGVLCHIFFKRGHIHLRIGDGFLIITILWIVLSAAGAIPYLVTGTITNPADALFESCSGFTTTGATVLSDISQLPHGILFWRAATGWLGGIAILLFAIAAMPALGLSGQRLNSPYLHGPVLDQPSPKMISTIRTISLLYCCLTLAETILLKLLGLRLFDALIHSMATISTCGFCRYDEGIAYFDSGWVRLVILLFMLAGGYNFNMYLGLFQNGFRILRTHSETKLYGFFLFAASLLIFLSMVLQGDARDLPHAAMNSLFHTASFMSTTGFAVSRYTLWPQFCQSMLLLMMFCGACTASCGGGLKVARLGILIRLIRHGVSARLHSNFFETVKMNGRGMAADMVSGVATMPFLMFISLFVGVFLLTFGDVSLSTAFNATLACLCNTGHAFGALGPESTFALFGWPSKLLLSLIMIGGRLELYAIVVLLSPKYWMQSY